MEKRKKVLLVDDHRLMLESVAALLERHGFAVAGKVTSAKASLEFLARHKSDAVLLDLKLPDAASLQCLRDIRRLYPDTTVVVFFGSGDEAEINEALDKGAVAYVRDTAVAADLVTAFRQAFQPSIFFRPDTDLASPREAVERSSKLTKRELEILRLVAEGGSNAEIARGLWVTEQTVKFHLANVYRKIGVANRTEAARFAYLHGLFTDDDAGDIGA